MTDTIPQPHPDEFVVGEIASRNILIASGFSQDEIDSDERLLNAITRMARVHASKSAETRWLSNIVHKSAPNLVIEARYDGWDVCSDGNVIASWNHNEEDLGTEGIAKLIEFLTGRKAEIEEVF